MMHLELLIASQNSFYREGVSIVFQRIFDECRIVHAPTITNLEEQLFNSTINLVLIDGRISQGKELEDLLLDIHLTRPELPVCMLTDFHSSKTQIKSAFELGVKGYIHSDSTPDEIKKIITSIIAGRVAFPESIWALSNSPHVENKRILTARQTEIMEYIEDGNGNKAIANSLNLSVATVKRHISNIFKVLDVNNRVAAINTYQQLKLTRSVA